MTSQLTLMSMSMPAILPIRNEPGISAFLSGHMSWAHACAGAATSRCMSYHARRVRRRLTPSGQAMIWTPAWTVGWAWPRSSAFCRALSPLRCVGADAIVGRLVNPAGRAPVVEQLAQRDGGVELVASLGELLR